MPISYRFFASLILSQFISLTIVPPEIPNIWVCTAPLTPTVHRSLLRTLNDGDIAEGGGDFTVVSFTEELVEFTVLLLVESVMIGSVCAELNEDITKSSTKANFLIIVYTS